MMGDSMEKWTWGPKEIFVIDRIFIYIKYIQKFKLLAN